MKIVHVVSEAQGGICRHVARLCRALVADGHECVLAGPEVSLNRMREFGLPDRTVAHSPPSPRTGPGRVLAAAAALRRLDDGKETLYHAHGYKAALAMALSGKQPYLVTAHNMAPRSGGWLLRLPLRRSAAVVAISPAVAEGILAYGVQADRARLIPNGVTPGPLPSPEERRLARTELLKLAAGRDPRFRGNMDPSITLIAGIGRLSFEKGFDTLLEAFSELAREKAGLALLLLGEGPLRAELETGIPTAIRGQVGFCGVVPDARLLLPGADMVAIPSRAEGQSLVALEALAAGVRVVATNAGGLPSVIRPGATGWQVRADDAADLARGLHSALEAPADRFCAAGRDLLEREFDEQRSYQKLASLYEEIGKAAMRKARDAFPNK